MDANYQAPWTPAASTTCPPSISSRSDRRQTASRCEPDQTGDSCLRIRALARAAGVGRTPASAVDAVFAKSRFVPVCHWLRQCRHGGNRIPAGHWQSQWHTNVTLQNAHKRPEISIGASSGSPSPAASARKRRSALLTLRVTVRNIPINASRPDAGRSVLPRLPLPWYTPPPWYRPSRPPGVLASNGMSGCIFSRTGRLSCFPAGRFAKSCG